MPLEYGRVHENALKHNDRGKGRDEDVDPKDIVRDGSGSVSPQPAGDKAWEPGNNGGRDVWVEVLVDAESEDHVDALCLWYLVRMWLRGEDCIRDTGISDAHLDKAFR